MRLFQNQKFLFWWFLTTLMVTTSIMLFTETMSPLAKVAFFTVPLGVQMFLMTLSRKPGIVYLCLIPKIFIDAFQIVLIFMYGGSIISVDMFLNLTTTSVGEASELLSSLLPALLLLLAVFGPSLFLAVRSLKYPPMSRQERLRLMKISGIFMLAGLLSIGSAELFTRRYVPKYELYPYNVLYNMKFAAQKLESARSYARTSSGFSYGAVHEPVMKGGTAQREIHILVVGETARACNWHLYGYGRRNTPHLDTLRNLAVFQDVLTQSNTTHKVVPIILSPAEAGNYATTIGRAKSMITAFKECGFTTVFLTNQSYQLGCTGHYFQEADIRVSVKGPASVDTDLLPEFRRILEREKGNLFIVVHLYGSHFKYQKRYTADFARYLPDKAKELNSRYREENINAFDNSIYATSWLLSRFVEETAAQHCISSLLYITDHGEDLMDDRRRRIMHSSLIPTYYQLHIPMLVWMSEEFIDMKPLKASCIFHNTASPISSNAVFHTVLDMASINTLYLVKEKSVSCKDFIPIGREYLTDHDHCINIDMLDMPDLDWEQFRKRGLQID